VIWVFLEALLKAVCYLGSDFPVCRNLINKKSGTGKGTLDIHCTERRELLNHPARLIMRDLWRRFSVRALILLAESSNDFMAS